MKLSRRLAWVAGLTSAAALASVAALVLSGMGGSGAADAVAPVPAAVGLPTLASSPADIVPLAVPSVTLPASPTPAATAPKPVATSHPAPSGPPAAPKPAARATGTPVAVNIASRLSTLPASTTQVIIVHASHSSTTYATLETWRKIGNAWHRAFAAMPARIGSSGFSEHHREGVPSTPVGSFAIGATMYGINANPGVRYGYHRLVSGDWWNENPSSSRYNTFQHSSTDPGGASEALWQAHVAYQYFAFIAYNVPAVAGRGSGIFLHVGTGGPTAGCVSLAKSDLIEVLTWLNPSAHPRIVMATDSELKNL